MKPGTEAVAEFILSRIGFSDEEMALMRPIHRLKLIARACHDWEEQRDLECFAGSQKYPKIGFWRSNYQSSEWIRCPRAELCLGGDTQNLLGMCDIGYTGPLCGSCSVGYRSTGPFNCEKCHKFYWELIYQFSSWIAFGLLIAFLAWLNSKELFQKVPVLLVYSRMVYDFAKELSLIVLISFIWPQNHQTLF